MSIDTASTAASAPVPEVSMLGSTLSTIVAMLLVLALAYMALRFLQRRLIGSGRDTPHRPQILSSVAMGPKERIVCFRYRDREYLLAVSTHSVTTVDQWDLPSEPREPAHQPRTE